MRWTRARTITVAAGLAVLVVVLPLVLSDLRLNQLTKQLGLALAVLGVSILSGRAGLVSLGHGVFVGIGALATARLAMAGLPLALAVAVATVVAGAFGVVLGLPALRVRGPHLALITLGTALAFGPLSKQFPSLAGGSSGLQFDTSSFAAPELFGGSGSNAEWRYALTLGVIAGWFLLARNLVQSRVGRAIRASSENELAAAAFGVELRWTRTATLGLTAAMAGTGGALHAIASSFALHTEFDAVLSFRLYAAAVLGGVSSVGPLLGTGFLVVVPEVADRVEVLGNQDVVFGLALLVATIVGSRAGNRSEG